MALVLLFAVLWLGWMFVASLMIDAKLSKIEKALMKMIDNSHRMV